MLFYIVENTNIFKIAKKKKHNRYKYDIYTYNAF